MNNPFDIIDARLRNIESLLLEMKHGKRVNYACDRIWQVGDYVECNPHPHSKHLTKDALYEVIMLQRFADGTTHRFTIYDDTGKRRTYYRDNPMFKRVVQ